MSYIIDLTEEQATFMARLIEADTRPGQALLEGEYEFLSAFHSLCSDPHMIENYSVSARIRRAIEAERQALNELGESMCLGGGDIGRQSEADL